MAGRRILRRVCRAAAVVRLFARRDAYIVTGVGAHASGEVIGAHWMPAALGLASAASWGAGDFFGGLAATRTNVCPVVIGSQIVGAVALERLPSRRDFLLVALAGVFDAGGHVFVVLAAHAGRLHVAAVLSSLYPASTALLAMFVLKERVSRWQFAGVVIALSAIVMITLR